MEFEVAKRSLGVDVSSHQEISVNYPKVKFVVVKVTEGTNYINPKASGQLRSAKAHSILPMGYFYARHSNNVEVAKSEAKYACENAIKLGLPVGSYLADDWESGSGNNVQYDGTSAVLAAMKVIESYGFKPLVYSGAYLFRSKLNVKRINAAFPNSLWVAAYAQKGRMDKPNFNYFPSMDGVLIWQFTDNWQGLNVDGNINLLPLKNAPQKKKTKKATTNKDVSLHPIVKYDVKGVAVVCADKGAYIYNSSQLTTRKSEKLVKKGSIYELTELENGAVKIGKNAFLDGRACYVKLNPIAYSTQKSGVVKIMQDHTHALATPDAEAKKLAKLPLGKKYRIVGRKGRFLELKDKFKNQTCWVTGNRAYIVL